MIEMLGVLAIIGVLSVGGIAGYSKAMQKYRTNKTIEQVTQIINGIRTLYSGQKNYDGAMNTVLRKAKILPESAWESTSDSPRNPFGGYYNLWTNGRKTSYDCKAAILLVSDIPDDACIELATQDWGAGEGLYAVDINYGDVYAREGCNGTHGSGYVTGCAGADSDGVPLPIPMDYAISACTANNANEILFSFY